MAGVFSTSKALLPCPGCWVDINNSSIYCADCSFDTLRPCRCSNPSDYCTNCNSTYLIVYDKTKLSGGEKKYYFTFFCGRLYIWYQFL